MFAFTLLTPVVCAHDSEGLLGMCYCPVLKMSSTGQRSVTSNATAYQEQEASELKARLASAHAHIEATHNHVDKATTSPDSGAALQMSYPRAGRDALTVSGKSAADASKIDNATRFPTKQHHEGLSPHVSSQRIPDMPHGRRGKCRRGSTGRRGGLVEDASAAAESGTSSEEGRERRVDRRPPVEMPDPKFEADRFDADICELFHSLHR